MKITAKQFALSFYESLAGKTAEQAKAVIKKFVEFLAGKNMLGQADKIEAEFLKIWNEKNKIIEAEVMSASGLDKANVKLLKNYIASLSGAKEVLLNEKIDKSILGGVIIKYGDKILDASLRIQLEELREKLVK